MIEAIHSVNNNVPNLAAIQEALELIDAVEAKSAETTIKKLKELLIEYILANMSGDTAGAKAIQEQMAQLLETYGKQTQHANEIKAKLKGNSPLDSTYIQNLIGALRHDIASGDMSNLTPF